MLILALSSQQLFGQENKELIIERFDVIEYYSDSTIKRVYSAKKGIYHGYSIEFDSTTGAPVRIGKYKKGKKHGIWYWGNGWNTTYKKGEAGLILIPGCSAGKRKAKEKFIDLYNQVIGGKIESRSFKFVPN